MSEKIESITQFIQKTQAFATSPHGKAHLKYWYRGQADATWTLTPKLYRTAPGESPLSNKDTSYKEREMMRNWRLISASIPHSRCIRRAVILPRTALRDADQIARLDDKPSNCPVFRMFLTAKYGWKGVHVEFAGMEATRPAARRSTVRCGHRSSHRFHSVDGLYF